MYGSARIRASETRSPTMKPISKIDATFLVAALPAILGCAGKPMAAVDGPASDGPPSHIPGMPGLGAHAIKFYHLGEPPPHDSATSITTPAMATQSGSTIIVGVGRGDNTLFALPT